jgi:hypothetical protein
MGQICKFARAGGGGRGAEGRGRRAEDGGWRTWVLAFSFRRTYVCGYEGEARPTGAGTAGQGLSRNRDTVVTRLELCDETVRDMLVR